jgi:hypothetical protein
METALPKDDLILHKAFETFAQSENIKEPIRKIALLMVNDELTRENIQKNLAEYGYTLQDIKNDLLDILISYTNIVLEDNIITENEKRNFAFLKLYFKIKESDFYKYKLYEIKTILHRQFEKLYFDNNISEEEALHSVNLQDMFDLSYNQFDEMKEEEIKRALENGANILNLDTANIKLANKFGVQNK